VVPAQKEEAVQILHFVGKAKADCLDALQPTVDTIAKKEVAGLGGMAAIHNNPVEVMELAMDVAAER
jgi:hypothetical protein